MKYFVFFAFSFCLITAIFAQNVQLDSLKIEKEFSAAIGESSVLDSLQKAIIVEARKNKHAFIMEDTYWFNLSKARFLSGELDAAFIAAEKGIRLCQLERKMFRAAKFFNLKASIYAYQKDNEKAIDAFKTSLSILEGVKDFHTAALIRNNIANIFFGLSDYQSAYEYSAASYRQLYKEQDTNYLPSVTGIFAISALKLGKLEEGKSLAIKALYLSKKYSNPVGLIVSNHSMGEVLAEEKKYAEAIKSFNESLKFSEMYKQNHFIMLNKLGLQHVNLMAKHYLKSIQYGEEALVETNQMHNENTLYAIHKNLGYAFNGLRQSDEAFQHLALAHELYIESAGIENQKTINDILIKYDTEKKEKELVLSRLTNVENQNKLIKRAQWITILVSILVFVLVSYFFYNRLQKQRLTQLKRDQEGKRMQAVMSAEEKERERISNELHDGMASAITSIKLKLEGLSKMDEGTHLAPLLQQLENLHDETRRMSHNLMPLGLDNKNWAERIEQYCRENTIPSFKIIYSNNLQTAFSLDPSISVLLYRSMQELIHNAQKHSRSSVCHVQVSKLLQELVLSVEDEGIGFIENKQDTQGLKSMRVRLIEIGAMLEIESKPDKGTLMSIHLNLKA
ncbi:MAG: signal transduction histidine kinase [Crocinitomicaceae bacterium]|jgi:signal transduction histidine kinase